MIQPDAPATRRLISVLTPCYNEEANVEALYERVRAVFAKLDGYRYEHLFIDNASTDRTVAILREIAARDRNVKVIVNTGTSAMSGLRTMRFCFAAGTR